jgi:hypothetical protein
VSRSWPATAVPQQRSTTGERCVLLLLAGSLAALAVPVLLAPIPPLLDYPNHLVRLWLISGGTGSPPLSQMYAVSWGSAHTNVGIDYLGALLGTFIPAIPLGSLFIALALVLPPLGAVALNRAVLGGLHWWQIAFVYFAWNATLIAGFLNFHIGLGLALLAAALEPRLSRSGAASRAAARLAIAALLLVVHIFALAFYCALVAGVAFGRHLPTWRQIGPYVWRAALAAAPAATPALIFTALAPVLPGAHVDQAGNAPLWDFSAYNKTHVLLSPFVTYALHLDVAVAATVFAPWVWALSTRRLRAHAGLLVSACGLVLLALLAPTAVAGTWWIDNRFPIMAALALVAATRPDLAMSAASRTLLAAAMAGLVVYRTAWIGGVWQERQADVAALHRAVAAVPPGSAILPLDTVEANDAPLGRYFHNGHPTHWSLPVLAIMWRQAFVPNLFWAAGKQPLRVVPPWDQISFPEDGLLPWDALPDAERTPAYFRSWRERYQYVLLVNADAGKGIDLAAFPELRLEKDEGFARLYAVRSRSDAAHGRAHSSAVIEDSSAR